MGGLLLQQPTNGPPNLSRSPVALTNGYRTPISHVPESQLMDTASHGVTIVSASKIDRPYSCENSFCDGLPDCISHLSLLCSHTNICSDAAIGKTRGLHITHGILGPNSMLRKYDMVCLFKCLATATGERRCWLLEPA